ncbi:MAG: three-Cys-motif partner protein TcmP [Thermodesulfovibrionia bacterium]|nr:three-Cys-motif partner protein TcmP [Thermodesulfovibrionia bacterium]
MKKNFGREIGEWSEIKLKCIHSYLGAYSNILTRAGYKEYYFIDGFASTGFCKSKQTSKTIRGSATLALTVNPPFSNYFFIELDANKVKELEKLKTLFSRLKVEIFPGDCNIEIATVLQKIGDNTPFIALLDPQAGDLFWDTIQKISEKNKAELLINFPFGMAINRYMPLVEGKAIDSEMRDKLNKIFGTEDWGPIYYERKKGTITASQAREKYLDIYLIGLKKLGFRYYAVKNLKNSKNVHIYYLIFASRNRKGLEKMKDNFIEGEPERQTLFFKQDIINAVYNEFVGSQKITLDTILGKMLTGKNLYRVQDFKNALIHLEKVKKLIRINPRPRCRSFNETDLFKII